MKNTVIVRLRDASGNVLKTTCVNVDTALIASGIGIGVGISDYEVALLNRVREIDIEITGGE